MVYGYGPGKKVIVWNQRDDSTIELVDPDLGDWILICDFARV